MHLNGGKKINQKKEVNSTDEYLYKLAAVKILLKNSAHPRDG